ncbi:MAG: hypothetical protein DMF77_21450, partial [Acidobacteria bacterium]
PVYPYFLAALYRLSGTFETARWTQALIGALLVPAVGLAGARAFSPRVGRWAAVVTALYPDLIWFSVHFWSETVFMVLLWWGIERLLAADAVDGLGRAAAAGMLWGVAVLTRETVLYFIPLAALWLAFPRGREGARGGAPSSSPPCSSSRPGRAATGPCSTPSCPSPPRAARTSSRGTRSSSATRRTRWWTPCRAASRSTTTRCVWACRPSATASPGGSSRSCATRCRSSGRRIASSSCTSSVARTAPSRPPWRWRWRSRCSCRTLPCSRCSRWG